LLVRRGVEIVLGLLHGVRLMQRLLCLLLMLLLQAANTGLRTAKTGRCAIRGADLPCNLPIALRNTDNVIRLTTLATAWNIISNTWKSNVEASKSIGRRGLARLRRKPNSANSQDFLSKLLRFAAAYYFRGKDFSIHTQVSIAVRSA